MDCTGCKVLYVEDQPEMIELVRLTLKRMGCEVYGVMDGREALQMMRDWRPDLVLLDLMLPGWDGWQIRSAMQADPELKEMLVILVTARAAKTGSDRQLPHAHAYITKPFSLADIRSTVQSLLHRRNRLAVAA